MVEIWTVSNMKQSCCHGDNRPLRAIKGFMI